MWLWILAVIQKLGMIMDGLYISVEEKMAMFLMNLSRSTSNCVVKRRFNHSLQTIHYYFHEVLQAMLKFSQE